jgi:dihydropyrimidine dehydrogenase (NAD+) subunit PreT
MAEYKKPATLSDFEDNFSQKKPLMSKTEAYMESSRCLFCYDAPCMKACPTHIDIPLFIKQIHTGNVDGAAETIFDSNWLGSACGKVCPTGVLCEGACVYTNENVKPIDIGRLQYYATEKVIREEKKLFTVGKDNGRKVAIIGAGPAGIACACELRTMGYQVDIFEAKGKPSGLTVHGTAPYKITNEEALAEMDYLQKQLNYTIHYHSPITTKEQILALEKVYDAIFLGVGIGPTSLLGLEGENNEKFVVGAVEFIEELREKQHEFTVPNRVIVLGGGNTAMDAASESARMGAEDVKLVYRRPKEAMGAYDFEYKLALNAGVQSVFNTAPVAIIEHENHVELKCVKTELVNGSIQEIADSEFSLEADLIIKATGQAKMGEFFGLIDDLKLDSKKRIVVNENTFQTSNPSYFAGGDAVNGGAEVVNGAYDGKMAAKGIDSWLNSKQTN